MIPELLAPAGSPSAGHAALHYGADAVYVGLLRYSARADADNFALDSLGDFVAWAHSLAPRRRVYVAMNTLLQEDELAAAARHLPELAAFGVDALIVQDMGMVGLARRLCPDVPLHASTQMAVHNREGVRTLAKLGFKRVVLARELSLDEIQDAGGESIETEVFIHGALCYSYSGLCLLSSMAWGRSGNRGTCAQPCRGRCRIMGGVPPAPHATRDPAVGLPFSLKDLALGGRVQDLVACGVASLKIEGRKKSPLYVAAVTHAYRRLLDGPLDEGQLACLESDIRTIFSRETTTFHLDGTRRIGTADPDVTGHRGAPIGTILALRTTPEGTWIRLVPSRPLERHDGLVVPIPGMMRPFGFAVTELRTAEGGCSVFESAAGIAVETRLPEGHPAVEPGMTVYCGSSQAVKRAFCVPAPPAAGNRHRWGVTVRCQVTPGSVTAVVSVHPVGMTKDVTVTRRLEGKFTTAKTPERNEPAARAAFERLGDTAFRLDGWMYDNPDMLYVPPSRLNELRRCVADAAGDALAASRAVEEERAVAEALVACHAVPGVVARAQAAWFLKTDRMAHLDAFTDAELGGMDGVTVDISVDPFDRVSAGVDSLVGIMGADRVRLALPILTRAEERQELVRRIAAFRERGFRNWEIGNLSGWTFLGVEPHVDAVRAAGLDIAGDWSLHVMNGAAAEAWGGMGFSQATVSVEGSLETIRSTARTTCVPLVAVVYQDTPLLLSESCAWANLCDGCPTPPHCPHPELPLSMGGGLRLRATSRFCRTVVTMERPFSLAGRTTELLNAGIRRFCVQLVWRMYSPEEAAGIWRRVRAGERMPHAHPGNMDRGFVTGLVVGKGTGEDG